HAGVPLPVVPILDRVALDGPLYGVGVIGEAGQLQRDAGSGPQEGVVGLNHRCVGVVVSGLPAWTAGAGLRLGTARGGARLAGAPPPPSRPSGRAYAASPAS